MTHVRSSTSLQLRLTPVWVAHVSPTFRHSRKQAPPQPESRAECQRRPRRIANATYLSEGMDGGLAQKSRQHKRHPSSERPAYLYFSASEASKTDDVPCDGSKVRLHALKEQTSDSHCTLPTNIVVYLPRACHSWVISCMYDMNVVERLSVPQVILH